MAIIQASVKVDYHALGRWAIFREILQFSAHEKRFAELCFVECVDFIFELCKIGARVLKVDSFQSSFRNSNKW